MSAIVEEPTYCAVHPDRETGLRCITCDRLMCVECAVRTPVGYRCKQCARGQQDKFFTASTTDDGIVFAVCAALTALAAGIVSFLPFGIWIALIAGLPVGGGISEAALRLTKRRRSRQSHIIAAAGAALGGLAIALLLGRLSGIGVWLFVGLVVAAIYGRYRMSL
jgi:hypothetical protein